MWEKRREMDLKAMLGRAELAKRAAQFLIHTRLLPQHSHANVSSTEEDVSDVDNGEAEDAFGDRHQPLQNSKKTLTRLPTRGKSVVHIFLPSLEAVLTDARKTRGRSSSQEQTGVMTGAGKIWEPWEGQSFMSHAAWPSSIRST